MRARKMTPREVETIERTIRALLSDCIARCGELDSRNSDYAEAHGVYRTVKALNFDGADAMWHRLQKWAIDTVKGEGKYEGAYCGPVMQNS
jgi:hypothetical protein